MINKIVLVGMVATCAFAVDVGVTTGALLPNTTYLKKSSIVGMKVAGYTNTRHNGVAMGVAMGAAMTVNSENKGSYADLTFEMLYRVKHNSEPYVLAGAVLQKIDKDDYATGYEYGIGYRYTWCSQVQFAMEFTRHQLKYNSNVAATASANGAGLSNMAANLYMGYRF